MTGQYASKTDVPVLPDGSTVGDQLVPELREIIRTGQLPPLMPGLPSPGRVIELGERTS